MYPINSRFEWDSKKAIVNLRNHGVSFEDAAEALSDPNGLVIYDQLHSIHEDRFCWIGLSSKGVLSVVITDRQDDRVCRIISARRASRNERIRYYENEKTYHNRP